MLTINLKPIFSARGIEAPLRFLMKNGFTRDAAFHLIHTDRPYIKLHHIERLCELLICEPNDLFNWHPDKDAKVDKEHPLIALYRPAAPVVNFKRMLADVPYRKLTELSEILSKEINGTQPEPS